MQEKRRLAWGRRTLERLPADADDRMAALETRQHVAHRQCARQRCRTRARLRRGPALPQGRSPRQAPRREHPPRTFRLGHHAFGSGVEAIESSTARNGRQVDDLPVRMTDGGRRLVAEHDIELREPKDKHVAFVDEHDVDAITEGVRKNGRQLESAEACAKHCNSRLQSGSPS